MQKDVFEKNPIVSLKNIRKIFSHTIANDDVSVDLYDGEVLSLLGENGAGKSTIMKILYGLYAKDGGDILINGEVVKIKSPQDAMNYGIAMIQQHFSLVPTHDAVENIILGRTKGIINKEVYKKEIEEIAKKYSFDVPLDVPVSLLSVGQQQKVEILKALFIRAKILIMDEPSAVLTPQETDNLLMFIKDFASHGGSVIFITHKLKEVIAVSDRVVVMRLGKKVGEIEKSEFNEEKISNMMIGETPELSDTNNDTDYLDAKTILDIKNVSLVGSDGVVKLDGVSFEIREGEIFGIAGVSGNGQDEICDCVSGLTRPSAGTIKLDGNDVSSLSIKEINDLGLGYVPLDRYRDAMVMDMNLSENMLLKHVFDKSWFKKGFVIDKGRLDEYTSTAIKDHQIKAEGPHDRAGALSGGNQQKVVLAREVDIGSKLLILNQPTRGLDMGAVARIQNVILEERNNKKAVLLISTELSELFEMCDRIAVMFKGRIMHIFQRGEYNIEKIGLLMAGVEVEGRTTE